MHTLAFAVTYTIHARIDSLNGLLHTLRDIYFAPSPSCQRAWNRYTRLCHSFHGGQAGGCSLTSVKVALGDGQYHHHPPVWGSQLNFLLYDTMMCEVKEYRRRNKSSIVSYSVCFYVLQEQCRPCALGCCVRYEYIVSCDALRRDGKWYHLVISGSHERAESGHNLVNFSSFVNLLSPL